MTTGLPRLTIGRRMPAPLAAVALTKRGATAATTLSAALSLDAYVPAKLGAGDTAVPYTEPVRELLPRLFNEYHGLVLFMALGAAVRLLSPLLKSKRDDPAVVVVDEACTFAISVLSGHLGGANALAHQVGAVLHATPVITTGSDALCRGRAEGIAAGWRFVL
ncbi:MAG: hypothetical protein M1118_09920, partial [Chloroflexi bacterium]|nr:hypothetical protein [Chloroflexota bacterium]